MAFFSPIGDFLDADAAAGRVAAQAALLLRLRESASLVVPESLWRSASIANVRQGKVVIFAENNAMAAKLRLYEPRLIDLWARKGLQVSAIKMEVQPAGQRGVRADKHARLTPAASAALESLAAELPADSPLQGPVRTLARRGRR
jgi:hypothetical protein